MPGSLILITGSGRSGTSSMSGALHHLGLHVPGPYLGANDSNPKGFFESRWSVRFHNALCDRAGVHIADSRPNATALVEGVVRPGDREKLGAFLDRVTADHPQTVVKDPRIVWTHRLWQETATDRGLDVGYVTMLRHPAEVVGSRLTYYSGTDDSAENRAARRTYAIANLARWINVSLVNERHTRDRRRAFVRYADLLTDWRAVAVDLQRELGLQYDVDVASGEHCAVDDFLDSGLRRHATSWDGVPVPAELAALAEAVWAALQRLCDDDTDDTDDTGDTDDTDGSSDVGRELDALAGRHAALQADAAALAQDDRAGAVKLAQRQATEAAAAPAGDTRSLSEVGGRELLRATAARVRARLARTARR